MIVSGCGAIQGVVLPNESTEPIDASQFRLLARFVHISDAHVTDEESPARLTVFSQAINSAWRPQEAYSTQLLDGTIRAINKRHVAEGPIDFVIHTGDAVDNNQLNEWRWFVNVFDGGLIDPRSGPDDRNAGDIPEASLDPHHPFAAQGLYRQGVHGPLPTISWYNVFGNHDHFALGVFPIVTDFFGRRTSPLPLPQRLGLTLPIRLDPVGMFGWGVVTPARPGPPPEVVLPERVERNADRRYATWSEAVELFGSSQGEPRGHGFDLTSPNRTWYSATPVPGLRLIVLNSSTPIIEQPTLVYAEGAVSPEQTRFLRLELARADQAGEIVVLATHHPSASLDATLGTSLIQNKLVEMLREFPSVKLHLAGHWHRHAVFDFGGYREIVTGSLLDAPQEGRIIEVWRSRTDERVEIRYRMFSHLDEIPSPDDGVHAAMFDDPLRNLRKRAAALAGIAVDSLRVE